MSCSMKENIKSRLQKKDILTVPNLLSLVRLALIPAIVILYVKDLHYASVALILLSAVTDVVDGWIARRFHMISDFGKFLDPVADKLTQAAMLSCLVIRYSWALLLVALLVAKELFQFVYGLIVLKKTNTMNSARWFGKVNTVVLYASIILLFLHPEMSSNLAEILLSLCALTMLCSMILYGRFFHLVIKKAENDAPISEDKGENVLHDEA